MEIGVETNNCGRSISRRRARGYGPIARINKVTYRRGSGSNYLYRTETESNLFGVALASVAVGDSDGTV